MIDYIVYGEFDINEGNVIKIEYPNKTGIKEMILSSYLIPEGTHNVMNDTFTFIASRDSLYNDEIIPTIKSTMNSYLEAKSTRYLNFSSVKNAPVVIEKPYKVKDIFNFNTFSQQWECLKMSENVSRTEQIYMKIIQDQKEKYYKMIAFTKKSSDDIDQIFEIEIHSDIQFQKLKHNFFSVYHLNSQAIGFEMEDEKELNEINDLFNDKNIKEIYSQTEETKSRKLFTNTTDIINHDKDIYFLCSLENKRDKSTKRGAIVKSVAVGTTKLINLNSFSSTCKYLLQQSFIIHGYSVSPGEKVEIMKKVIESTYNAFNSLKYNFGRELSRYERGIHSFMNCSTYFTLPTTPKKEDINVTANEKISIDLSLSNNEEKIFESSLIELIGTFKEYTMTIYDAIINDKKILFIGSSSTPCQKLSRFVFSTLAMIGPFAFGFIKRLYPYKNLYEMDFLKVPNCIYAVTNPIFKTKLDSWDVLCEIDTGKIALSEEYKKIFEATNRDSDKTFIKALIYKINNEYISEYEVEQYFTRYTYHLLKMCDEKYLNDDEDLNDELNKQSKRKLKLNNSQFVKINNEYEKFRNLIAYNSTSFLAVERHVDSLRSRKNIAKEELTIIYNDIENFISGGEFYINLFMWLCLNFSTDFEFFLNGIFSKYDEVKNHVRKIYNILSGEKCTMQLMKKVNYLYLMKLNELEMIMENITKNGKSE